MGQGRWQHQTPPAGSPWEGGDAGLLQSLSYTNSISFSCFSPPLFAAQRFSNPCAARDAFLPLEAKVNFIFVSLMCLCSPRTSQLSPQGGQGSLPSLSQGCCSIPTGGCSDLPGTAPAPGQGWTGWARRPQGFLSTGSSQATPSPERFSHARTECGSEITS